MYDFDHTFIINLIIFNRIKLFQKTSKIFMLLTLKYIYILFKIKIY